MAARFNSWYQKAKDSAVGTSFDSHVMGGYKFLMRYYSPGDDIFFFGFSRGAYIARFLAEMLDYVGLLSQGNEELARFAWKTFSSWQQRLDGTEEESKKKRELFEFMRAFRETFSRPVRRIRFLGLFDTVNSVPRFESAWMERSKFPYTARSTAKVIRHAVGIDERRAKFRQDLLSGDPQGTPGRRRRHRDVVAHPNRFARGRRTRGTVNDEKQNMNGEKKAMEDEMKAPSSERKPKDASNRFRRPSKPIDKQALAAPEIRIDGDAMSDRFRPGSQYSHSHNPSHNPSRDPSRNRSMMDDGNFSQLSLEIPRDTDDADSSDGEDQDIEEIWFAGGHADIGGGWSLQEGEEFPLSHAPLVWMVREAQRAGLGFDYEKMLSLKCAADQESSFSNFSFNGPSAGNGTASSPQPPHLQVGSGPMPGIADIVDAPITEGPGAQAPQTQSEYHRALELAATKGPIHDCLSFNQGLPMGSVISWKIMEYLPFRRMDLQPDGSWKPIRWPLPAGETRDIPDGAKIHNSVIKRMKADPKYRPGNLIVGGGGRGIRFAPKEFGIGEWTVLREAGDPVGEVFIKQKLSRDDPADTRPNPGRELRHGTH